MAKAKANEPAGKRIGPIVRLLAREYPEATTALSWRNPLELLVATILSAQCTDERVNEVTKDLFTRYRSAGQYARADPGKLEAAVRPTGFFRNKAKAIRGAAAKLAEDFDGQVPKTMEEFLTLPGVARKTANVVLGTCFRIAAGVVVDTHVKRLSRRLGLTAVQDPVAIERDLMELLPKRAWIDFSHRLIWHGRRVCQARTPQCGACVLAVYCPSAGTTSK